MVTSKRNQILFPTITVAIGILFSVGLFEVAFRVFDIDIMPITKRKVYFKNSHNYLFCYADNYSGELKRYESFAELKSKSWHLEVESKPALTIANERISETPWCVSLEFDEEGYRTDKSKGAKSDSTQKIVIVGDSFVAGDGVPYQSTLPVQISELIGPEFNVVHRGASGASFADKVYAINEMSKLDSTAKYILVYLINDIPLSEDLQSKQRDIVDHINIRRGNYEKTYPAMGLQKWFKSLYYLNTFRILQKIKSETTQWYIDSYDENINPDGVKYLNKGFSVLSGHVNQANIAVVIYPLIEDFRGEYSFSPIHKKIMQISNQVSLPIHDLTADFRGQDHRKLWVHPVDHHPNGKANAIAAKGIVDWLNSNHADFLIP